MKSRIPSNVRNFIMATSHVIGRSAQEDFLCSMAEECEEYPEAGREMESPIEQILYVAINALRKIHGIKWSEPIETPSGTFLDGIFIDPQRKINRYRVDFYICFSIPLWEGCEYKKSLIVECDSQAFHDRTESERRYEKRRDRFLSKNGYTVFHYTGKEIFDNPFKVASEILAEVVPWTKGNPGYFKSEYVDGDLLAAAKALRG